MTSAQWRYYSLNQFLFGRSFISLPAEARDIMADVKDDWNEILSATTPIQLQEVESVLLNLMRLPFYSICSAANKDAPLLLKQIVDVVRQGDVTAYDCMHWPYALVRGVQQVDLGPVCMKDGTLYLSRSYDGVDLDEMMHHAFYLRCWGQRSKEIPESLKGLVNILDGLAIPREAFDLTADEIGNIFKLFKEAGVHPTTLARTALMINDLRPALKQYGVLTWWRTLDRDEVVILLPKTKRSDTGLVAAVIPVLEFVRIADSDVSLFTKMYVRGSQVVFA